MSFMTLFSPWQVSTWFANARRRMKKANSEEEKSTSSDDSSHSGADSPICSEGADIILVYSCLTNYQCMVFNFLFISGIYLVIISSFPVFNPTESNSP